MRSSVKIGVLGLSTTAMALSGAGVAFAGGSGATVTKFSVSPYQIAGATWTCSGNHIVNKAKTQFQDSESCLLTGDLTGYVPGTYSGAPDGNLPPIGDAVWNSDYTGEAGAQATSWTITITDNGNGTDTAAITAFYAS